MYRVNSNSISRIMYMLFLPPYIYEHVISAIVCVPLNKLPVHCATLAVTQYIFWIYSDVLFVNTHVF